ncbi:TOMM precursor leader peptide-binding protein [Streptomyces albireticuli]|uniref:Transcriptional activator protein n=1 Tax=Streptomyces albireticuli TaxID=1940 RepID=A0A2A2DFA4_9ACTN|nr:TOMM precursor leader peptide-binding protein [Streptomyces albireticuli]MCD9194529.1 TOMM precursor leader peptide-binding protein [Streptomyces albireticuli]PAU50010.1 transcriptional activator protein [Streptomyces albireticuli]
MLEAYEAIAETRPRIRRDVLFTETPDGVLFHNAHGGFHLNSRSGYRFATLLVPHLNGEHRVADLCEGLGEAQRAMVGRLVRTLYEREFARDTPVPDGPSAFPVAPAVVERFAPQIAYVDHYADDAARRFQEFRTTRVAVVGDDLTARWCVLGLVRNGSAAVGHLPGLDTPENRFGEVRAEATALAAEGCPVTLETIAADGPVRWSDLAGYDVVVVTGGREGARRLFRLVEAGVPEGTSLIPAALFGDRAVVGPLMTPGTAGCWACAVLRLGAHGDAAAAADLWSGICLPATDGPTGREAGRGLSAMIGNLLGYEVFRLTTGALPAETRGQVIVQDTESFDVVAEPLLPHPRCPFCRDLAAAGTAEPAAAPAPEEPGPAGGTAAAPDTEALLAELNSRQILIRPHTGVFEKFTDEPWTQTPLKVGTVSLPTGHSGHRNIAAFDVHTVAGARLTALNAAAGAYTEHVVPLRGVLTGEALDDARRDTRAVAAAALTVASGLAADAVEPAAWVRATSLADGEPVLVPAGAVRTFGPYNRDGVHTRTTAGTGAGRTAAEATARGLLSALCHDALERAVRGTGGAAPVAPEGFGDDPELTFLLSSARNLGVECELLDLGEPARSSAHVLLARALLPRTGERIWAVAGETDRRRAAAGALRDLLGQEQLGRELAGRGEPPVDLGDPLLGDLDPAALAVTGTSDARVGEATSYPAILERLRAAGREALVVPTDSADLLAGGISTVRVLLTREDARPGGGEHTGGASRAR